MRHVRRDPVQVAGAQNRFFVAIGEAELAREHRAHVLLLMGVFGQLKVGAELHHDQAAHIAPDDAGLKSLAVPLHLRRVLSTEDFDVHWWSP